METSKVTSCSHHIQQPAAAHLYRKNYRYQVNAAALWLQPVVMNFDVFPNKYQYLADPGGGGGGSGGSLLPFLGLVTSKIGKDVTSAHMNALCFSP